jgi:hypothetical protein
VDTKKKLKNTKKIKRRKNFLPTLLLAILSWGTLACLIYFTAPKNNLLILGFYFLLLVAIFLTFALLFANSRRGLLVAVAGVGFLVFRYFDLANYLNLILFGGVLICLELFFRES